MDIREILSKVDYTLLSVDATFNNVKSLCDDAIKYSVASVCIAPSFVKDAKKYIKEKIPICTVVGFPNGYNTQESKAFETCNALENGANEIDMVVNIGELKSKNFSYVENEITKLKKICGSKVLKVIIETCLLSEEEKINMCKIVSSSGADFIKTSTGFSKCGAKFEDIILFKKYLSSGVKIKAAGGISTLKEAEMFISLGAHRLGTSKIIRLIKSLS